MARISKLWILWIVVAGVCQAFAFSRKDAIALYRSNGFKDSPPSIQSAGGYLFVIVEGLFSDSEDGDIRPLVMSAQLNALEKYIGSQSGKTLSPFSASLSERILPLLDFKLPKCQTAVVDEFSLAAKFRNVTVFEQEPIDAAREKVLQGVPEKRTVEEWANCVSECSDRLKTSAERDAYWLEIGAVAPVMQRYGGVGCFGASVDFVAIENALAGWSADADRDRCHAVLAVVPSFGPAYSRLAALDFSQGQFLSSLCRTLKASLAHATPETFAMRAKKLSEECRSPALAEFASLYSQSLEKSELFAASEKPLWRYVRNSFGFVDFGAAANRDDAEFAEARTLFSRGTNLERILQLLRSSIEKFPANSLKWRYYAAALRTAGKNHDAVVAYNQTLMLDPADAIAQADLCLLYDKMGCHDLADGLAWWIFANVGDEAAKAKAKSVLEANHGDTLLQQSK